MKLNSRLGRLADRIADLPAAIIPIGAMAFFLVFWLWLLISLVM